MVANPEGAVEGWASSAALEACGAPANWAKASADPTATVASFFPKIVCPTLMGPLWWRVWAGQALFRRCLGVWSKVPRIERCAIVLKRLISILLNVEDPTQVNVAPGKRPGIVGQIHGLLEVAQSRLHIAREGSRAGQDKQGAAWIFGSVGIIQHLQSQLLRACRVSAAELLLGNVQESLLMHGMLGRAHNQIG